MSTTAALTPTSYAILGLLAIKPWTTYELAKQMDRTLNRFWPRARSKLYEEPKKLVAQGLAEAAPGANGRRPRTMYSITPTGRRALAAWLATESTEPVFESEHILKVFYAESGSTDDVLATLRHLRWLGARADRAQRESRFELSGRAPGRTRIDWPALVSDGAVSGRLSGDDRPLGRLGDRDRRHLAARHPPMPTQTWPRWPARSARRPRGPSGGSPNRQVPARMTLLCRHPELIGFGFHRLLRR